LLIGANTWAYTWNNIDFHGFFGQGYMLSTHNNYYGATTDGSFHLVDAGFSATRQINDKLRIGGQIYSFRLGDVGSFDRPIVDWLYADYAWENWMGFRVGKVKTPIGIYGEFRDIDMARTGVFLPSNIYDPIFRDTNDALAGASIYGNVPFKNLGSVDYNFGVGIPQVRHHMSGVGYSFTQSSPQDFERLGVQYSLNGQLIWNTPKSGLRLVSSFSYSHGVTSRGQFKSAAHIGLLPPPTNGLSGLASTLEGSDMVITLPYYVLGTFGAEYMWRTWTFAAEFQRQNLRQVIDVHNAAVAGIPTLNGQEGSGSAIDSFYISANKRLSSKLDVGAYAAVYFGNIHDRDGSQLAQSGDLSYHAYQKELVGVIRYNITPWWEVKAEGLLIDGVGRINNVTGNQPWSGLSEHWFFGAFKSTMYF